MRNKDRYMEYAIGDWIHDRRKALGFSLAELGRMLDVNTATVHGWESGKSFPSTLLTLKDAIEILNARLEIKVVQHDGVEKEFSR